MSSLDSVLLRAFRTAVGATIERRLDRGDPDVEDLYAATIARVAQGVERARARGLLRRAWLFGSLAWGRPHDASDVDLLVEGADDPFLAAAVIEAGLGREVDLVRLERAPQSLRDRVLAEGRPL